MTNTIVVNPDQKQLDRSVHSLLKTALFAGPALHSLEYVFLKNPRVFQCFPCMHLFASVCILQGGLHLFLSPLFSLLPASLIRPTGCDHSYPCLEVWTSLSFDHTCLLVIIWIWFIFVHPPVETNTWHTSWYHVEQCSFEELWKQVFFISINIQSFSSKSHFDRMEHRPRVQVEACARAHNSRQSKGTSCTTPERASDQRLRQILLGDPAGTWAADL